MRSSVTPEGDRQSQALPQVDPGSDVAILGRLEGDRQLMWLTPTEQRVTLRFSVAPEGDRQSALLAGLGGEKSLRSSVTP